MLLPSMFLKRLFLLHQRLSRKESLTYILTLIYVFLNKRATRTTATIAAIISPIGNANHMAKSAFESLANQMESPRGTRNNLRTDIIRELTPASDHSEQKIIRTLMLLLLFS